MKNLMIFSALLPFCVAAQQVPYYDILKREPTQTRERYPYQGPSGKRYQYDLNNPGDRIRYDTDPWAQIRDEINPDPYIELDRFLGQPGGGAQW